MTPNKHTNNLIGTIAMSTHVLNHSVFLTSYMMSSACGLMTPNMNPAAVKVFASLIKIAIVQGIYSVGFDITIFFVLQCACMSISNTFMIQRLKFSVKRYSQ